MQIIISPAKKMRIDNDDLVSAAEPRFLKDTEILLAELRKMQYDDLKKLWQCNDEIAALNYKRLQTMRLRANLTPAVLAYDGIQYQYMAPRVFGNAQISPSPRITTTWGFRMADAAGYAQERFHLLFFISLEESSFYKI